MANPNDGDDEVDDIEETKRKTLLLRLLIFREKI